MRILIAASIPGLHSYEEKLAVGMQNAIKEKGYTVDSFLLPYKDCVLNLSEQIVSYRMLDLSAADMVIAIGYPACFLNHPNKYIYLLETEPAIHEYWDTEYGVIGNYQYSQILLAINEMERNAFTSAKQVFCASKLLRDDLKQRYQIQPDILYMPPIPTQSVNKCCIDQQYYICETFLPQCSRMFEFLKQYKESGITEKVIVYVPYASEVYTSAIMKIIVQLSLEEQIIVYEGHPADETIKNAQAALFFPYKQRRPDNFLRRCIELGTPVVVAEDSGYAAELCGCENAVSFTDICRNIKSGKIIAKISNSTDSMDSFVRGIMKYEDSSI